MNHRRFASPAPTPGDSPRPAADTRRGRSPTEATTPVIAVNRGYVEPCCAIEGDGLIIYSVRSAIIGFTFAARRAGMMQPTNATTRKTMAIATKVAG